MSGQPRALVASSFAEAKEQNEALQTLLCSATSGYAVVSVESGMVCAASRGLSSLFGAELCGAQLLDLVSEADHQTVQGLFAGSVEPVLAMCLQRPSQSWPEGAEFEARVMPYKAKSVNLHIAFQKAGELKERNRDTSCAGSCRIRKSSMGASQGDELDARLRSLLMAPATGAVRHGDRLGSLKTPIERYPETVEEAAVDNRADLWIEFDSGDSNFGVRSSSSGIGPRGKFVEWIPHHFQKKVEEWVINSVNYADEDGTCQGSMANFELTIPAVPAQHVTAERVTIQARPLESDDDGSYDAVPAILHMEGVRIKTSSSGVTTGALGSILEYGVECGDEAASCADSEGPSPSESASAAPARRFVVCH